MSTTTLQDLDRDFPSFERELVVHCYRMLGSFTDAEDLVQETYLRARRGLSGFAGRSSLRTWLYRIATNVCLTALHPRQRRVLPSGLGAPADDPETPLRIDETVSWLEPLPDATVADPGEIVAERDSVRIALIAALQYLAPRQRAALLLREVLDWSAAEIGEALGVSEPAVKSLLQRGRARLAQTDVEEVQPEPVTDATAKDLLERYQAAFEAGDAEAIAAVIGDDFSIEATTCLTWFKGIAVCLPFFEHEAFGKPGARRLLATRVNGQPALAHYEWDGRTDEKSRTLRPLGVSVLTIRTTAQGPRITRSREFMQARWVTACGLPPQLEAPAPSGD